MEGKGVGVGKETGKVGQGSSKRREQDRIAEKRHPYTHCHTFPTFDISRQVAHGTEYAVKWHGKLEHAAP